LKELKLGREGIIYIVANDGAIIAESVPLEKESALLVKEAWARYSKKAIDFLQVGHRIFYVNPFPKKWRIPWNLVTSIHEDDYLKPIHQQVFSALKIGLIPCFLFMLLSTVFFGRVSRRLKQIAWEMDAVGNLSIHFESSEMPRSRIREVNVMNHALNKMKVGLKSFSRYVPTDLIKKLIFSGHSAELGGEKKEMTILFADMANFTTLAERLEIPEVVQIIETFLTAASNEVHREKGVIDKFMGDAVMALWGAPEQVANPELSACRTALALQKMALIQPHLQHRIGINSGQAMVGNFGSLERMDFTAIGDTVNISARLEKLNKRYDTKILIGPTTAEAVREALLVRPIDWVMLQGRTHPLLVFELIGDKQEITASISEGVAIYSAALDHYHNRQFEQAGKLFEQANQLLGGNDTPSKLLAARCYIFQKKDPPSNWNGTEILAE
jgi:adenylate cyclase